MNQDAADLWEPRPSCLDSAYERRAVAEGLNDAPVFPENIAFLAFLRSLLQSEGS